MSKKKGDPAPKPDPHKPARMVRVKAVLAEQLDIVASRNATDFSDEVNRAVRELLERAGLWPPGKAG